MEANSATYTYDPSSKTQLASNPLLRDPLEEYWVDIRERYVSSCRSGALYTVEPSKSLKQKPYIRHSNACRQLFFRNLSIIQIEGKKIPF